MSITAYDGLARKWWSPEDEVGQDNQAEFELKPLSGPELLEVQAHYDVETLTVLGPGLVLACKFGLKGWKNITDEEGEQRKWNRLGYAKLPGAVIAEMGGHIINMSLLDEGDAKNS